MDRLSTMLWLGVILSFSSMAVVAYRNDLSSRHGCIWSTIEKEGHNHASSLASGGKPELLNPQGGSFSLNCNLRTLNSDFWNYTFNREQIERTKELRIKCSDKLFFDSLLSPNQTLFKLRNLKEVQIESCKIRKVPARLWASLTKLKNLTLRSEHTDWLRSGTVGLEIEPEAFQGLEQTLELLDISQNNIFSFPNVCSLRSLIKLNISYNRLSDVDELIDDGNNCEVGVQSVDLSHNSLRRLGQDAFSRMKRVAELRLQNNYIGELEDSTFSSLNGLKLLNLSSNRLVALPPFIFKNNPNLRELYLQNNSISALSSQVFGKLEQLLLLDLSRNSLSSQWVKEDIFKGLVRLVVLKLSYNQQISYIDPMIFRDLISLQALHLDNNRIETINPEAFLSLSNLHILDLSNNRLSFIDGKMLSNLFVLRQLYLDHNKIRKMEDESLGNCSSLQDLGLADNLFQEVPVALSNAGLGFLKTLDIGENKIVSLSNTSFTGMAQLYGLRLVDNKITKLPSGFCTPLKMLRVLNLSQNRINSVSSTAFTSCSELRVLRLDTNALEELPPSLAPQLPSLLWLNVSENRLKWADYHLLPVTLEWLDLSYNKIENLSGPGTNGTNGVSVGGGYPYHLRVLDVSYNKLSTLEQSAIPPSLETLRVNHNELRTVGLDTFILSSRLRRVEMMGNSIEYLPLQAIRVPQIPSGRTLPEFYLAENPFVCTCEMEWVTRTQQLSLLRQHPRIVDLDSLTCTTTFSRSTSMSTSNGSPGSAPIPLLEAKPRDFLCPYKSHCFALCHCCEFDYCDCQMECPDNCTCYHDTAWSSNIVECSSLSYENVPARIPMDATEIYLDGNHIFQLGSHIFIGKKNLRTLYLNDSHVEVIKNKTFNGLKSLEILRLEENLLSELNGYEFMDLENLRELYLHNNMLRYISEETFVNLKFLQVLRLDGNHLVDFSVWELSRNGYLNSVMLGGNPWTCDCEFLAPFRSWVSSRTAIVVDFALAKCQDGDPREDQSEAAAQISSISSMCDPSSDIIFNYEQPGSGGELEVVNNHISPMIGGKKGAVPLQPLQNHHSSENGGYNGFWPILLCLTAIIILAVVILAIFREEIYFWATNWKYGTTRPKRSTASSNEDEKLFDAYFLYSRRDEDILVQKIVPELEEPATTTLKFRLCLHYRDLCMSPESPWNREMILSACDASKKVIILLSKNFLHSEFSSSSHFRTSIQSAIGLHQKKLIFILLPDFSLENLPTISSELGSCSNTMKNQCVQWSEKNFWTKFKRLLPTPSSPYTLGVLPQPHPFSGNVSSLQDPQLPYNLVMNPNLHNLQQFQRSHYQQNIIPYQIPIPPAVPKHQIVLPALQQVHPINIGSSSLIHPQAPQLTPQHFAYSNETFHRSNNLHHGNPNHFSSQKNPHQILSVLPPHSHTASQVSNFSSSPLYPQQPYHQHHPHHHHPHQHQNEQNYSSSAVSSYGANDDQFEHVYSTLDYPPQSPDVIHFSPSGEQQQSESRAGPRHTAQHSSSSGVSSGSDMTCGESGGSAAVSPSSPIKAGILNKLSEQGNGQMYFV